jgi:hypothetical protein
MTTKPWTFFAVAITAPEEPQPAEGPVPGREWLSGLPERYHWEAA